MLPQNLEISAVEFGPIALQNTQSPEKEYLLYIGIYDCVTDAKLITFLNLSVTGKKSLVQYKNCTTQT